MSDAPDLSKIVGLIMENPALIEQISALVKKDAAESVESTPEIKESLDAVTETTATASEPTVATVSQSHDRGEKRARLLGAIKPYLSGERQRALDTMISLSDILNAVRR